MSLSSPLLAFSKQSILILDCLLSCCCAILNNLNLCNVINMLEYSSILSDVPLKNDEKMLRKRKIEMNMVVIPAVDLISHR